jgi:hypothetical protein
MNTRAGSAGGFKLIPLTTAEMTGQGKPAAQCHKSGRQLRRVRTVTPGMNPSEKSPDHPNLNPLYQGSPAHIARAFWYIVRAITRRDYHMDDRRSVPPDKDQHVKNPGLKTPGVSRARRAGCAEV